MNNRRVYVDRRVEPTIGADASFNDMLREWRNAYRTFLLNERDYYLAAGLTLDEIVPDYIWDIVDRIVLTGDDRNLEIPIRSERLAYQISQVVDGAEFIPARRIGNFNGGVPIKSAAVIIRGAIVV